MYRKVTTLQMMLCGGVRVQSGRTAVFVCMKPLRCGECSGAPHWPVGCDSLTDQGAFEYAGTMRDDQAIGVLAGVGDSTREGCELFAWLLQYY